jgi:hypothetical protein
MTATQQINIQEQTFEVYGHIIPHLIIDPCYDPIEYNNYLNKFRLVGIKKNNFNILEKKECSPVRLFSGNIINIDKDYLKCLHIQRIQDIDDELFSDFMLELRILFKTPQVKELLKTSIGNYLINAEKLNIVEVSLINNPKYLDFFESKNTRIDNYQNNDTQNRIEYTISEPTELQFEYCLIEKKDECTYNVSLSSKFHDQVNSNVTSTFCYLEKMMMILKINPKEGETLCFPNILTNIKKIEYDISLSKNIICDGYYLLLINRNVKKIYFNTERTFIFELPKIKINLSHLLSNMKVNITLEIPMEIKGYVLCKEKIYRGIYKTFSTYCYDIKSSPEIKIVPVISHSNKKEHRIRITNFGSTMISTDIFIIAVKNGIYDETFNPFIKCEIITNGLLFLEFDKNMSNLLCHTLNKKPFDPCVLYWCFNYEESKMCSYVNFNRIDVFEIIIYSDSFDGEFRIYTESIDCLREINNKIETIGYGAIITI